MLDIGALRPDLAANVLHLARRTQRGRVHQRAELDQWAHDANLPRSKLIRPAAAPNELAALIYIRQQQAGQAVTRRDQGGRFVNLARTPLGLRAIAWA
ncbi:MAG: hypothetical protein JO304_01295 [Solirubrobacterales bacterium]|nr:hypothetical protein [Solirubrobacterales bacterium]